MTPLERKLAERSRDKGLLLRIAAGIAIAAVAVAFGIRQVRDRPEPVELELVDGALVPKVEELEELEIPSLGERLREIVASEETDPAALAEWLRDLARAWRQAGRLHEEAELPDEQLGRLHQMIESRLEGQTREAFLAYLTATTAELRDPGPAAEALQMLAAEPDSVRFANELLGSYREAQGEFRDALAAYAREVRLHDDAHFAARRAVALGISLDDRETVRELLDFPHVRGALPVWDTYEAAIAARDYLLMFRMQMALWVESFSWPWVILTGFCAAIWFVIIQQTCGLPRSAALWGIAAVPLGVASTFLTVFIIPLQESYRDFGETGDLINDAIYFTAGVGLREEFSKLVLFLPLIPFLRRRGSEALAFAAASWVGLGFAVEENVSYYRMGGASEGWGRFLSANFMHFGLTGLAGLAAFRLWNSFRSEWERFLGVFLGVVAIHGVYDLALSEAVLALGNDGEFSIISLFLIGVMAYWYFQQADEVRAAARQVVSPLAVFVVGASLMLAVSLNMMLWNLPFSFGLGTFGNAALGMAPIAFIFINRFRDA